jgi:hypothetical protein
MKMSETWLKVLIILCAIAFFVWQERKIMKKKKEGDKYDARNGAEQAR